MGAAEAGERVAAWFWRRHRREARERLLTVAGLFWRRYRRPRLARLPSIAAAAACASVIVAAGGGVLLGRGQTGPALPTARTVAVSQTAPKLTASIPSQPTDRVPTAQLPPAPTTAPVSPLVTLHNKLLPAPAGYSAGDAISIGADEAARLGSDPARERDALSRAGFRIGVLRRYVSTSGGDQLAILGYELADAAAADSYLAHAVEDFRRNVRGASSFATGVERSSGFVSRTSTSSFVFVYLAKDRYVFAVTSGGRSTSHDAAEGRGLAEAQRDRA